MHKNLFSSVQIDSLVRQFLTWLRSDEHKTERLKAGKAFIAAAPLLFILHLFFITHNEPGILTDSSLWYGYQTTFLTFTGVVLLPYVLFAQTSGLSTLDIVETLAQWGMALVFSAGNILLVLTYLLRKKLRRKGFRKRSIAMVVLCIAIAFFSADLRTFYFGFVLWLAALIILLAGLLLIHGAQQDETL